MKKSPVFATLFLGLLAGCSSIVSKSDYVVSVASVPASAAFEIKNREGQVIQSGLTPANISLKASSGYFKGESYSITFKKDGHADTTHAFASTLDGWYFGNIMLGGLIGMLIVDPATGAMFKLPERVSVQMESDLASRASDTLTLATVDSLTDAQRSQLVEIE